MAQGQVLLKVMVMGMVTAWEFRREVLARLRWIPGAAVLAPRIPVPVLLTAAVARWTRRSF